MFRFFKKKTVEPLHHNDDSSEEKNEETFKPENNDPLVENKHFYIENGCYVFTAYYLKNRGYCCGNGCRHCPYE